MTNLGDLPVEILSLIIRHLENRDRHSCTLVNKRFHTVANPILWALLMVFHEPEFVNWRSTITHSNRALGQHVRALGVLVPVKSRSLLSFLKRLPLLQRLLIYRHGSTGRNIPDTIFQQVPRLCPHLKSLVVHKIDIGQVAFETNAMNDIHQDHALADKVAMDLTRLHQLKKLSIGEVPTYFARQLLTFAAKVVWPRLVTFKLDADVDDTHMIPFIQTHPGLTTLELKCAKHLTDATLDAMPNTITELDIKFSRQLTTSGILRLIRRCGPSFTSVALRGCRIDATPFLDALDGDDDHVYRRQEYSEVTGNSSEHTYLDTLDRHALDNIRRLELPLQQPVINNNKQ
ncbi:unnamed protein product [Absidia cylindrospora]